MYGYLVIIRNGTAQVVKNGHPEWVPITNNPIPFVFNNGSTALTLNINKEGIRSGNWEIKPMVMPPKASTQFCIIHDSIIIMYNINQIKRSAVDRYGLASFELMVSWTGEEEEVPLQYFMDVHGIS